MLGQTGQRTENLQPIQEEQKQRQLLINRALNETAPGTCVQGIDGLCGKPALKGHIVPRSRLNLIAESGKVQVFEPIPFSMGTGANRETGVRPVRIGIATTEFYLCDDHETRPFQEIEQKDLCWEVSRPGLLRQLMLLDYKALLPVFAKQEWAFRAWSLLAELSGDERSHIPGAKLPGDIANDFLRKLRDTAVVKRMLEQWLRESAYENMAHYITQTGPQPIVASNAFFVRSGVEIMDVKGPAVASIPPPSYRAPQCITAYPSGSGQWVVRSWLTPNSSDLKVRRLWQPPYCFSRSARSLRSVQRHGGSTGSSSERRSWPTSRLRLPTQALR